MSWKDYFYFTKTERNGIVILIALIILVMLSPLLYSEIFPSKVIDFSEIHQKADHYEQLLADYHKARQRTEEALERRYRESSLPELTPFPFDPNQLGTEGFLEMGLSERIASNIVNYRRSGGTFRYKEDLNKIYSISDALYAQLEPFINLPMRPEKADEIQPSQRADTAAQYERQVRWADVLIDINRADTTQWQQIRGIGPVFSSRIYSYRDLLGGFYSTGQLLEVFGMDSARFAQIEPHLTLEDTIELRKININTADFAILIRHPYLNRNQVNSILRMREVHGPYQSVDDLKRSELINDELLTKVAPYLVVND